MTTILIHPKYVRKEIKNKQLFYNHTGYHPSEEFQKLALEVGYSYSEVIYKEAKSAK